MTQANDLKERIALAFKCDVVRMAEYGESHVEVVTTGRQAISTYERKSDALQAAGFRLVRYGVTLDPATFNYVEIMHIIVEDD